MSSGEPSRAPRGLRVIALLAALAVLAGGVPLLDDVGPTWDQVDSEYDYGGLFFHYLWTGNEAFLNFSAAGAKVPMRYPAPYLLSSRGPPHGAFALSGMASAACVRLLWTDRPLVAPMAVFHLPVLAATIALVVMLVLAAGRRLGLVAGLAAAASLLGMPRFAGEALGNLREVPEAALALGVTLLAARALGIARPRESGSPARAGGGAGATAAAWCGAGLLLGLSLATGPQVVSSVPLVLLLTVLIGTRRGRRTAGARWRRAIPGALLAVLIAAGTWWGSSPWYWTATGERLADHLAWIGRLAHGDLSLHLWQNLLLTTPLPLLVLAVVGWFAPRVDSQWRLLIALGVLVPLARSTWPGVRIPDGVRPVFVALPFLALSAGTGLVALANGLRTSVRAPRTRALRAALIAVVALVPAAGASVSSWPHGHCWYNALTGGLGGAQAAGRPDASDSTCASYWQALSWLSEHAAWGADVLVPIGEHVALAAAPVHLRPDIDIVRRHGPLPNVPLYVLATTRAGEHHGVLITAGDVGTLAHEISLQGGAVCRLWRIDDEDEAKRLVTFWRELHDRPWHRLLVVLQRASSEHPELVQDINRIVADRPGARLDELAVELRPFVPVGLHAELDEFLATELER